MTAATEVKDLWGSEAGTSSENILTEFDDLFMKHKADIGRCTIAKHPVETDPGAVPHRKVPGACLLKKQHVPTRKCATY